jgi:hypothetical protein
MLRLQGHPGDTSLFLLPAHAAAPTRITASLNMNKPHASAGSTAAAAAAAAAAASKTAVQTSIQVHNLAIGLDGILTVVAAVEAATAGLQTSSVAGTAGAHSSSAAGISRQRSEQQADESTAAAAAQPNTTSSSSDVKLHLELLQCQLLSCRAAGAAAATARIAAELMPWEVPLQQLPTCSTADGVLCDLLLDLPYISLNLGPAAAAATVTAGQDGAAKPPPMVLVQRVGVYLPEAPGSGVLLPVLSIPSVLFRESPPPLPQQQQQQQQGDMLLHAVHIPAVGASLRPLQVQHLVQLVDRQQQQWQHWTAGIAPKHPKQNKQKQPQRKQQQQQQLAVMLDDLQLLLLPAHGTSDKGVLLHLQQLQLQHEQNMPQLGLPYASSSSSSRVLQQAKVSWSELSLSAVQQQDDAAAADSSRDWFGDGIASPAAEAAPGTSDAGQPQQQQQQQQGEFRVVAASLPAVSWLLRTSSSSRSNTGQQQYPLLPLPSGVFASAAAAAAAAGGGGFPASGSGLGAPRMSAALPRTSSGALREALSNQATLTRFLSANDSWHGSVIGSMASADSYLSAHGSSSMALGSSSGSSWVTAGAGSSRSSTSAAAVGSSSSGSRPAAAAGAAAAAAVPMLDPQSSIIAASWQLDPPGASPPAGLGLCGSLPVPVAQSPSSRSAAAAVGRPPVQPAASSAQQQQRGSAAAVDGNGSRPYHNLQSSRSISFSGRGGASDFTGSGLASGGLGAPNLWRRSASPPGLLSISLRNVHSAGALGHGLGQGLGHTHGSGLAGHSFGSHWQDDDAEFYSIAGDSSAADDVSTTGEDEDLQQQHTPKKRRSSTGGTASAAAAGVADGAADDDNLLLRELLPLAGFDGDGCLATARWLLLSLSAGCNSSSSIAATAVQVTVDETAGPANASTGCRTHQQQLVAKQRSIHVLLQGWQLHVSGKSWDMAAACLMQAVNAAAAAAAAAHSKPKAPSARPQQQQQQQQQQTASTSGTGSASATAADQQQQQLQVRLLLNVEALQVMLFIAPEGVAPCNPRQLKQQQQQQQQEGLRSSRDCGLWQDPGDSPTAAAAAARVGSSSMPRSAPPMGAASIAEQQQQQQLAAETVMLKLSASAELATPGSSSSGSSKQQLVLQSFSVPELSSSVGAVLWDAVAARPFGTVSPGTAAPGAGTNHRSSDEQQQQQQQQHALLVLLLKDLGLQHTVGSGGATADAVGADANANSSAFSVGFALHVGSVNGWVSTTRLSLLLNLQQQLMAQLPAISAAADLAGAPAKYRSDGAVAAAAADNSSAAGTAAGSGYAADAFGSSRASLITPAASGVFAAASSSGIGSSDSRSARLPGSSSSSMPAVQQVITCSLTVHKLAVLCSTDEPDHWLLQQHGSSRGAAAAAAAGDAPIGNAGSRINSSSTAPFTTCATPLLELALLPLQVDVQLATTTAAAGPSSSSSSRRVLGATVHGSCSADVYSVDKLGWEPLLDPWEFKVGSSLVAGVKFSLNLCDGLPFC